MLRVSEAPVRDRLVMSLACTAVLHAVVLQSATICQTPGSWGAVIESPPGTLMVVGLLPGVAIEGADPVIGVKRDAGEDDLVIDVGDQRLTVGRAQVAVVRARRRAPRDSIKNGALIGAGAGAAYGVVVAAMMQRGGDPPSRGTTVSIPFVSAAIGAGIGAAIDRLRHGSRLQVIYSVAP